MPAIPLIAVGISSAATAYAAHKASNATKEAAKTQSDAASHAADTELQANREALDWTKKVYNREGEQQAPYVGGGGAAATSLSQLLGLGTPAPWKPLDDNATYNPNTPQGPNQAPIPAAPGVNVGDPRLGNGQPVTMVAPTGEEKAVPASEVQHWISKGASIKPTTTNATGPQMPPQYRGQTLDDVLAQRTA